MKRLRSACSALAVLFLVLPAALTGQDTTFIGRTVEIRAQSGFRGKEIKAKGVIVGLTSEELVLEGKKGRRSYPLAYLVRIVEKREIHRKSKGFFRDLLGAMVGEEGPGTYTRWVPISVGCLRPEPLPGTRVRVSVLNGLRADGLLLESRPDMLILETRGGAPLPIGRLAVEKIEWRSGRPVPAVDGGAVAVTGAAAAATAAADSELGVLAVLGLFFLIGPGMSESLNGWNWESSCQMPTS